MTNEELNNALYEAMLAEREKYRQWLLVKSSEEIETYAYENAVRKEILTVIKHNSLSYGQAVMLLNLESPISDLFAHFVKWDIGHMDIKQCVKRRAEELLKAQRELPVYQNLADYAQEHDELEAYHASLQANINCKEAIEDAIVEHYKDYRLEADKAVEQVVEQFGCDRVFYVLVNTVRTKDNDGRISGESKEWADKYPSPTHERSNLITIDRCNPGLVDIFLNAARKSWKKLSSSENWEEYK